MSSIPLTPEQRAARWGTAAKIAAYGILGFFISPFVLSAIQGLLGLIALVAIYGIVWVMLPAIGDAGKNLRLKLIKAEAARNPIETLEAEHLRRTHVLQERKVKIENLAAKTNGFGTKLAGFKRDYPEEAPVYQEIYDKMVLLLKRSREQWVIAEQQLEAFEGEIEKAKAKWAMALAASDLRQDAGRVEAEFLAKLKVNYSFETIETGMNLAFAQLDTLLMEGDKVEINVTPASTPAALPAPNSARAIPVEVLNPTLSKTR